MADFMWLRAHLLPRETEHLINDRASALHWRPAQNQAHPAKLPTPTRVLSHNPSSARDWGGAEMHLGQRARDPAGLQPFLVGRTMGSA
jgi:hypothetical protein